MQSRRTLLQAGLGVATLGLISGCASRPFGERRDPMAAEPYRRGSRLHADDFKAGLGQWRFEAQVPSRTTIVGGALEIDSPEGYTAWFTPKLSGPLLIEYEAQAVSEGGPNDQVSDLNAFWMATDPNRPGDLLAQPRSGAFADYDTLQTYYVGQGGNRNTTTRFRRYIGKSGNRPILPEHDLGAPADLLVPNQWQTVRLVAFGNLIQYWRDDRKIFTLDDPEPYTEGWFGVRTTKNRLRVRDLRIHRLTSR